MPSMIHVLLNMYLYVGLQEDLLKFHYLPHVDVIHPYIALNMAYGGNN